MLNKVGPDFTFSLPGGAARLAPVSYATGFCGHITTRESKGESGILIVHSEKVFVTGSAWQWAFEDQLQSFKNLLRFDKSSIIWANEVWYFLLTFFTLGGHFSYVSERQCKIFGTNVVTHPRNAWMTESNMKVAQVVLLNITRASSSQSVGASILYPRVMHNSAAIQHQLQSPPSDFVVFYFVGLSPVFCTRNVT